MRRIAVACCSLLAASAVTSAANAASAHVVLRIQTTGSSGTTTILGRGSTESSQRRSKLDLVLSNGANSVRYKVVLSAAPALTLFLFGQPMPNAPKGATWARTVGPGVAPLIDPSLPLRLERGRALGAGRHAVRIAGVDAALLAPAASPALLRRGFTGTIWVDDAGRVNRFKVTVPFGTDHATIDERLSAFGAAGRIDLPRIETVYDPSVETAKGILRNAVPDVEAWRVGHATAGYTGMTAAKLRRLDHNLSEQLSVVRATRKTYCIEATLNGVTVNKNGPDAEIAVGRCRR
jgi:hypothetical protein